MVGAHLRLSGAGPTVVPLEPGFEHGVLLLSGAASIDGAPAKVGDLTYLGGGRSELAVTADQPADLLLIGGTPFEEQLLMWWNFVGRSHEEIVADRADWAGGTRFGTVKGYPGAALAAPPMPTTRLMPRPRRPA